MVDGLLPIYSGNASRDTDAQWYFTANAQLRERARRVACPLETYAGIVAAFSPLNAWDTVSGRTPNMDDADKFLANPRRRVHFNNQMRKARAIRRGANPLDVLTGPKERAFYLNLTRPGATDAVTVDRWMIRAAGIVGSLTAKRYRDTAQLIRDCAEAVGLTPDAFQAAIWAQIRRESADA
jgi:hypothetical protein